MKKPILSCIAVCLCALAAATAVAAQQGQQNDHKRPSPATSAVSVAARVPVVIVGTAAKVTWVTTKFTVKHVAAPVAKTVFVKATPAATKFALRNSAKYLLPFATKLSLL